MKIQKIDYNVILTIFLLSHIIIWTIIPSISNNNLPLDIIEAIAWSDGWPLGWDKHPPLSSWFAGIFFQIFGNQDWSFYFLSQLFVIFSFIVVWKFSLDFFQNKIHSLISILLLEGIYFYNFTTPEFNVNVCQLPFWALSVYYCWQGIKKKDNISWLLFGLFAGLGVLSKYLFIYLLVAVDVFFIYIIIKKKFYPKCLISLITFFLILVPHLVWLQENDYITLTYALSRTGIQESNYIDHIYYPFSFLFKQIGILLPFFIMLSFIISKFKFKLKFKLRDIKLLFLLTINFVPIILIFLTSLIMGVKIRTMWMTPFYLFIGVLFVYIFQSQINLKKLKYFFSVFLILFFLSPVTYLYISITQTGKRTDYPGKEIAAKVQEKWNNNFKNTIDSVIGDEWHAGNLSYHLVSKPKWYSHKAAFIDKTVENFIETIGKRGMIIVNGECSYGISFTIDNKKICMSGSK